MGNEISLNFVNRKKKLIKNFLRRKPGIKTKKHTEIYDNYKRVKKDAT